MSQGKRPLQRWEGQVVALRQGAFLFGSHGAGSYFMETPISKDYFAQENLCPIKRPYSISYSHGIYMIRAH